MKKIICLAFILTFSISHPLFSQPTGGAVELTETSPSCGVCQLAESESFAKSAPGKIGRGVVNILFSWTNLFAQPIQAGRSGGSVLNGIGSGFVVTFNRLVQGVVELGLFWVPPAHGEPLSHCTFGDMGITGR